MGTRLRRFRTFGALVLVGPFHKETGLQHVQCATMSMATRFEVVIPGDQTPEIRAAAEEALRAVHETEALLSPYLPTSDIWRINHHAWQTPVHVSPITLGYLKTILDLNRITAGAFDINVGRLMQAYGFREELSSPMPEAPIKPTAHRALADLLIIDENGATVAVADQDVCLDLGAIGKGFALDSAAEALRALGVSTAFIHGGSSSATGLGAPPGEPGWKVAVAGTSGSGDNIADVYLNDCSLSVSTRLGRVATHEQEQVSHVIDPRTGRPISSADIAAAVCESAAFCDAATTALLVLGEEGPPMLHEARPAASTLVVSRTEGYRRIFHTGTAFTNWGPSWRGLLAS